MKVSIFFSIFFLIALSCHNESETDSFDKENIKLEKSVEHNVVIHKYYGKIGNYPITAFIKKDNGHYFGNYYYNNVGETIELMLSSKKNVMSEYSYVESEQEEEVELIINQDKNDKLSGKWNNKTRNKTLVFSLYKTNTDIQFKSQSINLKNCDNVEQNKKELGSEFGKSMFDTMCSTLELNLIQIELDDKSVQDQINREMIKSSYSERIDNITGIIEDYKKHNEHSYGEESSTTFQIEYYDTIILCLSKHNYSYGYGAAHPNHWVSYLCFDLSNGKLLKFNDIINSAKISEFNKERYTSFVKKYNSVNWETKEKSFYENKNFGINDKGIFLLYNPYEIGSYIQGYATVFIKYSDVRECLGDHKVLENYK